MKAFLGSRVGGAAVLGVWAYTEERDTILEQTVSEMTHIAQIEQNEIKEDLADAQTQLQAFDPRFLQVNLMDAEGRVLVSSSVAGEVESTNRIGVAYTLEGKPFVSDIYLSPLFKRWVIYISAPVTATASRRSSAATSPPRSRRSCSTSRSRSAAPHRDRHRHPH